MSKIIVSLSERDIRDLELGNKVWIPVNPNLDHSNLQGLSYVQILQILSRKMIR